MKNTGTLSVLFEPRLDRQSKEKTRLYVRINTSNKRARFSLKRSFTTLLWDPQKSRLKGSSIEAQQINAYIDQVQLGLHDAYNQLVKERKFITPHAIMARFRGEDQIIKLLFPFFL